MNVKFFDKILIYCFAHYLSFGLDSYLVFKLEKVFFFVLFYVISLQDLSDHGLPDISFFDKCKLPNLIGKYIGMIPSCFCKV